MNGNGHKIIEVEPTQAIVPVREQILAPLTLEDMSVFLYETNFGGKKGTDFTFEGIKTLGINNGISTGDVRIEFLNDEKTEALFYCTATDRNGDTSSVVIQQNKVESGRENPNWVAKGCSRAIRNAIKARLPVPVIQDGTSESHCRRESPRKFYHSSTKSLWARLRRERRGTRYDKETMLLDRCRSIR